MSGVHVEQAVELLEKANADLEPELLPAPLARRLLAAYARAEDSPPTGSRRWRAS